MRDLKVQIGFLHIPSDILFSFSQIHYFFEFHTYFWTNNQCLPLNQESFLCLLTMQPYIGNTLIFGLITFFLIGSNIHTLWVQIKLSFGSNHAFSNLLSSPIFCIIMIRRHEGLNPHRELYLFHSFSLYLSQVIFR